LENEKFCVFYFFDLITAIGQKNNFYGETGNQIYKIRVSTKKQAPLK
jgi:hypothetical protein